MKPLDEQTVLITGATSGLGRELAQRLAERGSSLLLHGRDAERGQEMVQRIKEGTGNDQIRFYRADLSSLREVGELASQIRVPRLEVLVNNAGVGFGKDPSKRELSRDGYELRFAVNYLAPYLLTERLLPLLRASSPAQKQTGNDCLDISFGRDVKRLGCDCERASSRLFDADKNGVGSRVADHEFDRRGIKGDAQACS